jgi:intracellular septation protein A
MKWLNEQRAPSVSPDPLAQAHALQEEAQQRERWNRSKYSIAVDVGLALLFFVVAKLTNLTTAALVGAAAGLLVVVVQRFVRVDLLGGLAIFGVIMLLISAGFSLLFQDDWAVKMKSTLLGVLVAALMLSDAAFNRGRYFGRRLGFYLMQPTHPQRLAFGLGLVGLVMAGLNWGVARWASTDAWLTYATFLDMPVSIGLFILVLRHATVAQPMPVRG